MCCRPGVLWVSCGWAHPCECKQRLAVPPTGKEYGKLTPRRPLVGLQLGDQGGELVDDWAEALLDRPLDYRGDPGLHFVVHGVVSILLTRVGSGDRAVLVVAREAGAQQRTAAVVVKLSD